MKRLLMSILLLCIVFVPSKVSALGLENVSLEFPDKVDIGKNFKVNISGDFTDIGKDSEGVLAVEYEVGFSEESLDLVGVSAKGYDTKVGYSTKNFMLVSSVIPDGTTKCNDGVLSCSKKFNSELTFYVKSNEYKTANIKLLNINVASFKVDSNHNYNESNMIITKFNYKKSGNIIVKVDNSVVDVAPSNSIVDIYNTPVINNALISEVLARKSEDYKYKDKEIIENVLDSEKYYIKDIKIEDCKIKFDKNTYRYNVILPNDVNELKIDVKTNSSKVKYNISGASDLKGNNDLVNIEVNNGTNYQIIIMRDVIKERDYPNSPSLKKFLDKKIIMAIGIIALLVCVVIVRIIQMKDKKKELNK